MKVELNKDMEKSQKKKNEPETLEAESFLSQIKKYS
jgi:hypothetical protein